MPARVLAGCVSRAEEAADLSACVDLRRNKSTYSLPQQTNHPSTCARGHLQLDGQYPQRAHHCGGGSCCPTREVITIYIICFIYYFLFYANPLPSSIPPPLNLHNRQVDDCFADDKEILIEGGKMDVLAEEVEEDVGVDLSAGVVCKKYGSHQKKLTIFCIVVLRCHPTITAPSIVGAARASTRTSETS